MINFCADDYGISAESCNRIEECLKNGVLNKVSVLPNGEIRDFKSRLAGKNTEVALHINLVEGKPLTDLKEIPLIVNDAGHFKYSFIGLCALSFSHKRKELEKQLEKEIKNQIRFWKNQMGEETQISLDSHQHVYMIPLIFKTVMRVIKEENLNVKELRVPAEPLSPYLLTPSLYFSYKPSGLIKQWLLKFFALVNRREFKAAGIPTTCFMGVLFSGKLSQDRVKKLLPRYLKIAQRKGQFVEIGFHPGYLESGEKPIEGSKESFGKFYYSPWRYVEYTTLINLKTQNK